MRAPPSRRGLGVPAASRSPYLRKLAKSRTATWPRPSSAGLGAAPGVGLLDAGAALPQRIGRAGCVALAVFEEAREVANGDVAEAELGRSGSGPRRRPSRCGRRPPAEDWACRLRRARRI